MPNVKLKFPNKKTQIICTIGPATWDPKIMKKMIINGMNVARVNGAFADTEELLKVEKLVRMFSDKVSLMLDVKGPEVRMNKFPDPIPLRKGMLVEFGSSADYEVYPANYPNVYKHMKNGQMILVGDGDVKLEVCDVKEGSFIAKVHYGTLLKPGKALNFPGLTVNAVPLTERDEELLAYVKERNWEYVSASFVRNKKDAEYIRERIKDSNMKLIAKIEDAQGIKNINEILEVVDGIMIARGGIGIELGLTKIAIAQRYLLKCALEKKKFVVAATQMLESMIENPMPTRAEANDVGTAILLGADAIMLSGESSAGKYPVEAVEFMSQVDRAIRRTYGDDLLKALPFGPKTDSFAD